MQVICCPLPQTNIKKMGNGRVISNTILMFHFLKFNKKKNTYMQEIRISHKGNLRVLAKGWPLSSSRGTQCANTNVMISLTESLASREVGEGAGM